ncbi:hypothetical protein [Pontibacter chitinilyticus]|uniref:hypothetical protein n=1 Tax=Pontibacter chitinilyticus TaxID=2674989 RepID=UPI00321A7103
MYSEGWYSKQNNIFTLHSPPPQNKNFDANLTANTDHNLQGIEIRVQTNLDSIEAKKYKTILHFDNDSVKVQGGNIDTVLVGVYSRTLRIEIIPPFFYSPVPSFKSITTKELLLNSSAKTAYHINIPLSFYSFYYKDIGDIQVKDKGKYWQILNDSTLIKKGWSNEKQ